MLESFLDSSLHQRRPFEFDIPPSQFKKKREEEPLGRTEVTEPDEHTDRPSATITTSPADDEKESLL